MRLIRWMRSGWPCAAQYWRASLAAVSIASPPPRQRKTRGSVHRRELDEAIDELERRRIGDVAERLEGLERPQLLADGLGHVLAPVPDVGVPETGRAVQVAPTLIVPQVHALAAHDHELVPRDGGHIGERMPVGRSRRVTLRARDRARASRRVTLGAGAAGVKRADPVCARAPCSVGMAQPDPWLEHYGERRAAPRAHSPAAPRARAGGASSRSSSRRSSLVAGRGGGWRPPSGLGGFSGCTLRRAGEGALREHRSGSTSRSSRPRASLPAVRSSTSRAGRAERRPMPPSRSTRSSRRSASSATSCSSISAGTGGSQRVACPQEHVRATDAAAVAAYLRRCFAHLGGESASGSPRAAAAADLERVRQALGYGRIDLYGSSYGATLAQFYLRRYPRSVRTATLDGASLPSIAGLRARGPQRRARAAAPDRSLPRAAARAGGRSRDTRAELARVLARHPRARRPRHDGRRAAALARGRRARARCSCTRPPPATARRWPGSSPRTWAPSSTRAPACPCSGSRSAASRWARFDVAATERREPRELPGARRAWRARGSSGGPAPPCRTPRRGRQSGRGRRACPSCCWPETPTRRTRRPTWPAGGGVSRTAACSACTGLAHGVIAYGCLRLVVARFVAAGHARGLDASCARRVPLPRFELS